MASKLDWTNSPMVTPVAVAAPRDRSWTSQEWETIRAGCVPYSQDDRWFVYVENGVLHAHRSWTGYEVYRATFEPGDCDIWRIVGLLVESDSERYAISEPAEERRHVVELVDRLIAGELVCDEPTMELVLPAWKPRADSEARKRSAVRLAEAVLAARHDVLSFHLRESLSHALWKYTECDGKYNARFRSVGALGRPPSELHHEHVIPRKLLIDRLIEEPERCADIMATAVGCVVLREEHKQLAAIEKADPSLEGWDRYRAANVSVLDLAANTQVN